MITLYNKDNLKLLVGRVDQDVRFTERNGERIAIVRLKDRKGGQVDIFFKNDTSAPEHPRKLADRVENAKVGAGKWLSVLVLMEDGAPTAAGLDFKYQGIWSFKQDSDPETGKEKPNITVAVGYSTNPTRVNETLFRVSMAERTFDKETQVEGAKWYSIAFFDDDRDLTAKKAEKLLSTPVLGKKSTPCAIRCSGIRETEKDGNTYYNLTGYRIECMYDKEEATAADVAAAA